MKRTSANANRRFRYLECVIGVLTTVILITSLSFLAMGLFLPGPPEDSNRANEARTKPVDEKKLETHRPAQAGAESAALSPASHIVARLAWYESINPTILAAGILFALGIMATLTFVLCFLVLLRRLSRQTGPLIRIEYTGAPTVLGPFTANSLGVPTAPAGLERRNRLVDAPPPLEVPGVKLTFPKGAPSAQKEGPADRQEEAVIQYLFDQNLKLQSQLDFGQSFELQR